MSQPWEGPVPNELRDISDDKWRSFGDTIERIEIFAQKLLDGERKSPGNETDYVLEKIKTEVHPVVSDCGPSEISGIINAFDTCHNFSDCSSNLLFKYS
mgnify:CR=1 FL=1